MSSGADYSIIQLPVLLVTPVGKSTLRTALYMTMKVSIIVSGRFLLLVGRLNKVHDTSMATQIVMRGVREE